jgi:hypothetical protein
MSSFFVANVFAEKKTLGKEITREISQYSKASRG